LIVSQYGQSIRRPHRTCPRPPRGPPQAPWALEESTLEDDPLDAASPLPEHDSPLSARLSRAAQSQGGGCNSGQQPAHLGRATAGYGVIEVISLEVTAVISPHQLITQLPDAHLQTGVLLQKLSVALLDVLDDAVLGLHLISALL
jgi:hypothetical protein